MATSDREMHLQLPAVRLSFGLAGSGIVIFAGSAALAARLIWEQTVWTWQQGPQMVGFSLAHGFGALLLLFPILLVVWTIVVLTMTIWNLIRRKRIAISTWISLGVAAFLFLLLGLPEGFWERAFISQMVNSPRAGDLLVYAAYRDDLGTVKAFISHGLSINTTERSDWRTGLHAAAAVGDLAMAQYFVSKGSDVNALDRSGDSPLELATEKGHKQVADFLNAHGAKMIHGDETQHQKAIHDQVQEDIDEMHPAAGDRKPGNRR